jgi:ATP-binding cassette subfamily B protein
VDSVRENLRLGRPDASDAELRGALEAAGLASTVAALPHGLDTIVTDAGAPFSVGQRQRLVIARALVPGAPVLVLDEPTAALDEAHAEALHATLETLRHQVAVLISTHRLSSVSRADWVLVMEHGRIVEQGTPAQLIAEGPCFRRLFAQAP